MKKIVSITLIQSVSLLAASCGKVVDVKNESKASKEFSKTKIELPDIKKYIGYKKIGVVGSDLNNKLEGLEIKKTVNDWTYNSDANTYGQKYNYLSGKLSLMSSSRFDAGKTTSVKNSYEFKVYTQILKKLLINLTHAKPGAKPINKLITVPVGTNLNTLYNNQLLAQIYISFANKKPFTLNDIYLSLLSLQKEISSGINEVKLIDDAIRTSFTLVIDNKLKFVPMTLPPIYNSFSSLLTEEKQKEYIIEALVSKEFGLSKNRLDALFIQVKDNLHNTSKVHKSLVGKNIFEDSEIIMIGKKSKSVSGNSSKKFASKNITTGSFSEYGSAFIAGYQSAIAKLKWSKSEQNWEETDIVYLIGSTSDSIHKKKALAFRRGVEAVATNKKYSDFLKISFVSKVNDSSKSSKKIYRDVSSWKAKNNNGKTKLYEFSNSDDFMDASRRIVYIAGASLKDWSGNSTAATGYWNKNDDTGLLGALFNYKKITSNLTKEEDLSTKQFSSGVSIILDKIKNSDNKLLNNFKNRILKRKVDILGTLGDESNGTELFTENILLALYMKKEDRRLHKHTVFGGKLNLQKPFSWTNSKTKLQTYKYDESSLEVMNHALIYDAELYKDAEWIK